MKKFTTIIKNIFWNYVWIGVTLLLVAIILDLEYPHGNRNIYLSISINFIQAVGLSVVISSVFSWATESTKFINNIKNLLESIIIKRSFLSNLSHNDKKIALKSLIHPSDLERSTYPDISNYYEYFIDRTLSVSEKNVRSNYNVNCRAFFDETLSRIIIEGVYSYRLFPNSDGYLPIRAGFHQAKVEGSKCLYIRAKNNKGEKEEKKEPELEEKEENGAIISSTELDVSKIGSGCSHLDIELKVREVGKERDQLLQFIALQPTDGFRFELSCEQNISILDKAVFVVGAKYDIDISDNNKNITITCNQWINEGSGIAIMIKYQSNTSDSSLTSS